MELLWEETKKPKVSKTPIIQHKPDTLHHWDQINHPRKLIKGFLRQPPTYITPVLNKHRRFLVQIILYNTIWCLYLLVNWNNLSASSWSLQVHCPKLNNVCDGLKMICDSVVLRKVTDWVLPSWMTSRTDLTSFWGWVGEDRASVGNSKKYFRKINYTYKTYDETFIPYFITILNSWM